MGLCRTLVFAIIATGCGRIGFDELASLHTDGNTDGPTDGVVATTCSPWGNITAQTLYTTPDQDWEVAFHPSGLAMVFTRNIGMMSGLWIATRANTTDAFGAATQISILNTMQFDYGSVWSPDGNSLYYNSVSGPLVAAYQGGVLFSAGAPSDLPAGLSWELLDGELEVFNTVQVTNVDFDMHRMTRTSKGQPWVEDTAFYSAFNRTGNGLEEGWSTFDAAHQTLYFERQEGADPRIETITRPSPTAPFDPTITIVPELVPPTGGCGDPELSSDGLTLAMDCDNGTINNDIYFATRTCH